MRQIDRRRLSENADTHQFPAKNRESKPVWSMRDDGFTAESDLGRASSSLWLTDNRGRRPVFRIFSVATRSILNFDMAASDCAN
jgi:hypothetical protein